MSRTALLLGSSGHFGAQAARAFAAAGWEVRPYRRGTDMAAAAKGADLIVHGMNPPNYHDWARLVPEITGAVLAAARASGATVLIPGNVYVFGTEPAPWNEATPHRPVARKGRIRAEMEARFRDAAGSGVRTILLRAGDFMDPDAPGGLFDRFVLGKAARGDVTAFGDPDAAHAWAYLPDLARAAVALAEGRALLSPFEDVPYPGFAFSTRELAQAVARHLGRPVRITRFPWWMMTLASPFWELARELGEMRYLYDHPHWLDGTKFSGLVPGFAQTPLDDVLRRFLLPT